MTPTAYQTAQKQSLSGRALEREVFARVTARLAGAGADAAALAAALEENRRLWFTIAADLASPKNECPAELKAGLMSLAAFVERHTGNVLAGRGGPGVLVTVNRHVIEGLNGAPMKEAA